MQKIQFLTLNDESDSNSNNLNKRQNDSICIETKQPNVKENSISNEFIYFDGTDSISDNMNKNQEDSSKTEQPIKNTKIIPNKSINADASDSINSNPKFLDKIQNNSINSNIKESIPNKSNNVNKSNSDSTTLIAVNKVHKKSTKKLKKSSKTDQHNIDASNPSFSNSDAENKLQKNSSKSHKNLSKEEEPNNERKAISQKSFDVDVLNSNIPKFDAVNKLQKSSTKTRKKSSKTEKANKEENPISADYSNSNIYVFNVLNIYQKNPSKHHKKTTETDRRNIDETTIPLHSIFVDVSNSYISSFKFLKRLQKVQSVNATNTLITDFSGAPLRSTLQSIRLQGSPISTNPNYRLMVLIMLSPHIEYIDENEVTKKEREISISLKSSLQPKLYDGFLLESTDPVTLCRGDEKIVLNQDDVKESKRKIHNKIKIGQTIEMMEKLSVELTNISGELGVQNKPKLPVRKLLKQNKIDTNDFIAKNSKTKVSNSKKSVKKK